jgi:hypothetical protein
MQRGVPIGDQILEVVKANPGCTLDQVILSLSGLSWSDVFLEVDRLSRSGQLRLTKSGSRFLTKVHAV